MTATLGASAPPLVCAADPNKHAVPNRKGQGFRESSPARPRDLGRRSNTSGRPQRRCSFVRNHAAALPLLRLMNRVPGPNTIAVQSHASPYYRSTYGLVSCRATVILRVRSFRPMRG